MTMTRPVLLALALAAMGAGCAGPVHERRPVMGVMTELGEGVFRIEDPERGVSCYIYYQSAISCLPPTLERP